MRALRQCFAFFCLAAAVLLAAPSALAQNTAAPPTERLSSAVPKDINTRAKVHTELGSLYFQSGELIFALEELTIAISINPNYAQAYSTRGLVLYSLQELDSAEKDFRRAMSLDEKDPEIVNNYGWFLCQIGKEKESIEYFLRAIKNPLYKTPGTAYLNAGACYVKIGDLAQAEEYVRKSLLFSPENPQALFQLATIDYKRGNYEAAKQYLMRVVRYVNPNSEVLWLFIRVERRLGDRSTANSLTAQLRHMFPDSPEYQELLKGNFE